MYYAVNYPQYAPQYPMPIPYNQPSEFDWMTSIYIGLGIFLLVVLIYLYWCYTVYRYSPERVADKLITKFKAKNKQLDPPKYVEDDRKEFGIEIATLNAAQTIASAQVQFRDKETHNVIEYIPFTATNKPTCSPLDNSCIRL